jgi:RNA 2',3'-cyclic 3'-phosphodiesterase
MEYASVMVSSTSQQDLFGQPASTHSETHRLFFALMPDEAERQHISDVATSLQQQHPELHARWVKAERFHATLNFLGDFPELPEELVEQAKSAADSLNAASFAWTLDYAASFRGREPPCVLRSTTVPTLLLVLWQNMNKALVKVGLHRHIEHQFTPHVTLAYARRELSGATPVTPVAWPVKHFVLVHNVVGKGNYQLLGRWALTG